MNSILDMHAATLNRSAEASFFEDPLAGHLSDDQIDDHLIGDLAAEPAQHLASCNACTERVAAAASPIASFDSLSLAWSERRSATLPLPDLSGQKPVWQRHMPWAVASFALAFGIVFANVSHQINVNTASVQSAPAFYAHSTTPALTETASVVADPAPAQISTDNQMLKAVDDELRSPSENAAELGLDPADTNRARSRAAISVED